MGRFFEKLQAHLTKRNILIIAAIELVVVGLLAGILLLMTVEVQILLQGDEVITLEAGDAFQDPGATATAAGRQLEVQVEGAVDTATPGTYTLRYTARYLFSSGEACRTVQVIRTTDPTISLVGGERMTLTLGESYEEPGYTARDSTGGDLTGRVEIEGTVDTQNKGTYLLTYTVTDDHGRTTSVQRTVEVVAVGLPEVVEPEGKVIYLTFDDGPGQYTQQLLEVLEKYDVKATFFVVNTNYSKKTETLRQIVAAGHSIGIHSMSHDYDAIYASQEAFLEDVYAMQQVIYEATGVTTTLLRFPGGTSNSYCTSELMTALTERLTDLGFRYFDWNVDSGDASTSHTAQEVYNRVIADIGNRTRAVVLQHDIKSYSVEAVELIIQWGLANGYTFEALTMTSPACQHR